ncbi:phage tail sheath protein [Dyella acidisoli]|uniref:Tail sheath protein n=1 Tax=Dyella acidisoli TaxID=1867834 RepID=A0ABQ5XSL9_9GAMM|nr:phage tail sheath protein [Dyella acidisoli]GLQ93450.1 tail sheath protein [Dyella acidisoli]
MAQAYHHGVRVIEATDGSRTITTVSTAVIGLVAISEDADPAVFPLDTPVLVTDIKSAISKAGSPGKGTLYAALNAIDAQTKPVLVVVRVAQGKDAAETTSNVIGTTAANGRLTGAQALLAAQARLGVKPRILGAPGLDTQPVGLALATIAKKLRGMTYLNVPDAKKVEEVIAYRANFSQREVMLVWPNFTAWDTTTNATVEVPSAAYALGLRAAIDESQGWQKTLSNVAVNNVTGISIDVSWDLQDPATDAGILNQAGVTTLINAQGFRFWGNRTCSDEPKFVFESATRTAQVLADTIADGHMWAVDKSMYPSLVKDILEGINAKFREMKSSGYVIGASAWYDESANQVASLAGGDLFIDYDYTPVPPLEDLQLRQRITDRYLVDFAASINA